MRTEYVYKPVRFFLITFLITWVAGFIAAYYSYQKGIEGLQLPFLALGMFAPLVAVVIMMSGAKNKELRKDFWDRLSLKKIKLSYLLAILLIMPVSVLVATALSLFFGQSADQFRVSSELAIMDGSVLLSWLILFLIALVIIARGGLSGRSIAPSRIPHWRVNPNHVGAYG